MIFSIYILGIVLSIVTGRVFRSTLLKGVDAPFVMELPPYRVPMARSLFIHMWDRGKIFLKKMGKIILLGSIVVWALTAFPRHVDYAVDYDAEIQGTLQKYDAYRPVDGVDVQQSLTAKLIYHRRGKSERESVSSPDRSSVGRTY